MVSLSCVVQVSWPLLELIQESNRHVSENVNVIQVVGDAVFDGFLACKFGFRMRLFVVSTLLSYIVYLQPDCGHLFCLLNLC